MFNSLDFDLDDESINLSSFLNVAATHLNAKNIEKTLENENKCKQFEEKRKSIISPVTTNINAGKFIRVKRKFPGPAGVLPTRNSEEEIEANLLISEAEEAAKNTEMLLEKGLICSQAPNKFVSDVWSQISKHYGKLVEMYNVKWIQTSWNNNELVNQKIPFLAAMIKSLEKVNQSESSNINLTLEDESGELQGTINHNLFEKYGGDFKVGNILVLKNCSVLSSNFGNHPHLLITTKNLIRIYRKESDSILLQNINVDQFLKDLLEIKIVKKRPKLDIFQMREPINVPNKSKISNKEISHQNSNLNKCDNNLSTKNVICDKENDAIKNEDKFEKSKFKFKNIQNSVTNIFQDDNFDLDLNCDFDENFDEKIAETLSHLENNSKSKDCNFSANCKSTKNIYEGNNSSIGNNKISLEKNKCLGSSHKDMTNSNQSLAIENKKLEDKLSNNSDKNAEIWKSAFEGVDVDDFFSDF